MIFFLLPGMEYWLVKIIKCKLHQHEQLTFSCSLVGQGLKEPTNPGDHGQGPRLVDKSYKMKIAETRWVTNIQLIISW